MELIEFSELVYFGFSYGGSMVLPIYNENITSYLLVHLSAPSFHMFESSTLLYSVELVYYFHLAFLEERRIQKLC